MLTMLNTYEESIVKSGGIIVPTKSCTISPGNEPIKKKDQAYRYII